MAIVVCPIRFHDFKVPMKRNVLLSGTSLQRRTFADFSQVRWTYCFEIHWNFSFVAPFLEHFHSPLSCFNFLVFFGWAFCSISSSCSLFKSEFWLEKSWSSILQLCKNYKMSKHKLVPALALKWYPQGSLGSHRTSEVVWHLCSQSESRCQMHLQPSHFSFGPQQGAFFRRQFVIWARVLI